ADRVPGLRAVRRRGAAGGARAAAGRARGARDAGEPRARAARAAAPRATAVATDGRSAVLLPAPAGRGGESMMETGHGSAARNGRGRAARKAVAAYGPLAGSREDVLHRHLPLVRRVVQRLAARKPPHIELDD